MDLTAIPWRSTRHRGIQIHFYSSDRNSGRVLALIRMQPGCGYPPHLHRGSEEVLVLAGGYRDEWGEYRAGCFVSYPPGSRHAPVALPGSADCILLSIAYEGIATEADATEGRT